MTPGRRGFGGVVAVLGATGAVGRAALAQLSAWRAGPLRAGGRRITGVGEVVAGLGATVHPMAVDIDDAASLARFCAGCAVVVNCAGPACDIGDRVARAALAAGADYVDPAGDDALAAQVRVGMPAARRAVVAAGMMPGLTGLLPRYLAAGVAAPIRLVGYLGGRDRFTASGAVDYLGAAGFGVSMAMWRDGARVPCPAGPPVAAPLPFFPEPALAIPYLSTELEQVARELGLREARWHSVFAGEHTAARLRAAAPEARQAAAALRQASLLDSFGQVPYQLMVLELAAGGGQVRTLAVRGRGASELTGAVAALAAVAVRSGEVPPGAHCADRVLEPVAAAAALRDSAAVTAWVESAQPLPVAAAYEEESL